MKAINAVIDQIWDTYDVDKNNKLEKEETRKFVFATLSNLGKSTTPSEKAFDKMFADFDEDKSGAIEKNEMGNFLRNVMMA